MLVLTRKTDQRICIGEDITVTVVRIKGGSVQLGIEAPDGVQILRGELVAGSQDARKLASAESLRKAAPSTAPTPESRSSNSSGAIGESSDRQPVDDGSGNVGPVDASPASDLGSNHARLGYRRLPTAGLTTPSGPRVGLVAPAVKTLGERRPGKPRSSARCSRRILRTSSTARGWLCTEL